MGARTTLEAFVNILLGLDRSSRGGEYAANGVGEERT